MTLGDTSDAIWGLCDECTRHELVPAGMQSKHTERGGAKPICSYYSVHIRVVYARGEELYAST